ncbi:MAG: class I SAM-dependent methyltransferase [Pseudomonadota bacterium]
MPEYDDFAGTYQHWSEADSPYRIVEMHSFFDVLGPVGGQSVLDLACGEGRTARALVRAGAASVLGADLSPEMIRRAKEHAAPCTGKGASVLRYTVLDARDRTFQLDRPVDLVTAMYLFHYAETQGQLQAMADLIARNLKPGGRFVTYTISPDFDFANPDPRMKEVCGFDYSVLCGNHLSLNIGTDCVNIWQWSREVHQTCLTRAGLCEITWHGLRCPAVTAEIAGSIAFYVANPSCKILSARKPG